MAKQEKSKAEIYREERKERIAAAAKKNAKRSRKHPNAGKIAGKVIGIILIVAVLGGACYGILDTTGVFARAQTALTIGANKISVAEYGYMYYMQFSNTVNQAQQSEQQYGYNIYGFDYTKAPEDQESGQDEDGNTMTWADQFRKNTVTYLQEFYTMYSIAKSEGYTVNDEEKADIDEQIEQMRQQAVGDGTTSQNSISMSLNSYLKLQYGKGVTENFLRRLMEKEMVVQRFSEDKQSSFEDKYTDEELDKEYKEDTTKYDAIDMRIYNFKPETLTAEDGESEDALAKRQDAENAKALEKANALLAKVKDEESFKAAAEPYIEEDEAKEAAADAETATDTAEDAAVEETAEDAAEPEETAEEKTDAADETAEAADETADAAEDTAKEDEEHDHDSTTKAYGMSKDNLTSISEDAAKWAFAAKAGAKKAFAAEDGTAYALYIVKAAYPQEGVDVRHILFMTVDSETGEKLSDDEIAEKKAKSEEVLAQWESGPKTEDAFAELANENSDDTGSNTNGGLYEQVTPGKMVDSFDKWIFDENRKEGDVEIIESEYGYHIMYFVGNRDYVYRGTLRTTHTQDDYSSWLEEALDTVVENEKGMDAGYKRADRLIQASVSYLKSQADASSSSTSIG